MDSELKNTKRLIIGNLDDDPTSGGIGAYTSEDGLIGGDVFIRPGKGSQSNGKCKFFNPDNNKFVEISVENLTEDRVFAFPDETGTLATEEKIAERFVSKDSIDQIITQKIQTEMAKRAEIL